MAALPARIADLKAKFDRDGGDTKRVRKECLKLGIIDENGKSLESTNLCTEAGHRMEESEHSEASEYSEGDEEFKRTMSGRSRSRG